MTVIAYFLLSLVFPLTANANAALKDAVARLRTEEGKTAFMKAFPGSGTAFKKLCIDNTAESPWGDCHELILHHLHAILLDLKFQDQAGERIVILSAETKFDADAPNYLQQELGVFCKESSKGFVAALSKLPNPAQDKSLKFLNGNFHDGNTPEYDVCLSALRAGGQAEMAKRLEKFGRKPKR